MKIVNGKIVFQKITLDHERGIILDEANAPVRNCYAFLHLSNGLKVLADTIRDQELIMDSKRLNFCMSSQIPSVIPCSFDWFSVSIVNYFRFVALIDIMIKNNWKENVLADATTYKKIKEHCTDYVREIIPEIYVWRNKVSADFAATHPYKEDTLATLLQSLMMQVVYFYPYYYAGGYQFGTKDSKSEIPKWSLTNIYEKLCPRFWPSVKLKEIPLDSSK